MPLALDDSQWSGLTTAYGLACDDVIGWLRAGYIDGVTSEQLGDIINDIQHQGDTSSAMYAVAPHLLAQSIRAPEDMARQLVIHAGLIYASAQSASAVRCPPALADEFAASAIIGRDQVLRYLPHASTFDDFKYLVAALAGFMGYGRFGMLIEGFDLFEGRFHHNSLDEPFPDEP